MHMQWNQCWKSISGKINVKSLIWFRGTTTTTTAVWAISSSARGPQKRVANMCSVCARAGEEKETQNFVFWELLIFRKVWLGKIDFRLIILDDAYAVKSVLTIHCGKIYVKSLIWLHMHCQVQLIGSRFHLVKLFWQSIVPKTNSFGTSFLHRHEHTQSTC